MRSKENSRVYRAAEELLLEEVWELVPELKLEDKELGLPERSEDAPEDSESLPIPSRFGITSSEIMPSGWEEAEFPLPDEASDELLEMWEFSELEVPEESEEPEASEELVLLTDEELEESGRIDELEVPEGLAVLEETEELVWLGVLPHPAKATAKIAANANKVFFIFRLPRFEDVFIWEIRLQGWILYILLDLSENKKLFLWPFIAFPALLRLSIWRQFSRFGKL